MEQGLSWSGRERHCCFLNMGNQQFADTSYVSGWDVIDDGRGLALVDWDHDGDLDLWSTSRTAPLVRFFRNAWPTRNHYLMLRLEGTTTNRDAIGARVRLYLKGDSVPQVRSLHGGEGYLSQSSKWLHFGLGSQATVDRLEITWPDGTEQSHTISEVDRRYHVVQGQSKAVALEPRRIETSIARSEPRLPQDTGSRQALLAAPYPISTIQYEDFRGERQTLRPGDSAAVLVNLWTSSCIPCVQELQEFSKSADALRTAGISVLPLALNGVGLDDTDPAAAERFLERIQFPFPAGKGTERLLEFFQKINDDLFDTRETLPVPTSFLVDHENRVLAVYKGAVSIERMIQDLDKARLPYQELRNQLTLQTAEGQWFDPPVSIRAGIYRNLARNAAAEGDRTTAIKYYRKTAEELESIAAAQVDFARVLAKYQRWDAAIEAYRKAIQLDPTLASGHRELAEMLLRVGQTQQAIQHLRLATQHAPNDADSHAKLAVLLIRDGYREQGGIHFARAVELRPDIGRYHHNWARFLEEGGKYSEAIKHYQISLRQDKNSFDSMQQLAWLLATHPQDDQRNGQVALQLATKASQQRKQVAPRISDVLAAAHAELGDFKQAEILARRAENLARSQLNQGLAAAIRERADLYAERQPYRLPVEQTNESE